VGDGRAGALIECGYLHVSNSERCAAVFELNFRGMSPGAVGPKNPFSKVKKKIEDARRAALA
jgi:hypothetical protein